MSSIVSDKTSPSENQKNHGTAHDSRESVHPKNSSLKGAISFKVNREETQRVREGVNRGVRIIQEEKDRLKELEDKRLELWRKGEGREGAGKVSQGIQEKEYAQALKKMGVCLEGVMKDMEGCSSEAREWIVRGWMQEMKRDDVLILDEKEKGRLEDQKGLEVLRWAEVMLREKSREEVRFWWIQESSEWNRWTQKYTMDDLCEEAKAVVKKTWNLKEGEVKRESGESLNAVPSISKNTHIPFHCSEKGPVSPWELTWGLSWEEVKENQKGQKAGKYGRQIRQQLEEWSEEKKEQLIEMWRKDYFLNQHFTNEEQRVGSWMKVVEAKPKEEWSQDVQGVGSERKKMKR